MREPSVLGRLSEEQFLSDYWQRKPLLIRNAWPNFQAPIDADELAGLALEDEVDSRLIIGSDYAVEQGPFAEERFASLPTNEWTLLVQAVDLWVPEVAEMLRRFSFLPRWRIDDIMVSYATDGGGVGPHFDDYDVFLLELFIWNFFFEAIKINFEFIFLLIFHHDRRASTPLSS